MAFAALPRLSFARPSQPQPADAGITPGRVKADARRMHEATLAADLLPERPAEGEAVHTLMSGRYDLAQVVTATVRRWPVSRLTVATLSANKRTLRELLNELDAGTVGTLAVVVSGFFARHNKGLFLAVRDELRADYPGSTLIAAKTHAKITLFEFADGSCPLVFEGSANLRKNDSLEQLTAIRDRSVFDWHRRWIDALVTAHANDPIGDEEDGDDPHEE